MGNGEPVMVLYYEANVIEDNSGCRGWLYGL